MINRRLHKIQDTLPSGELIVAIDATPSQVIALSGVVLTVVFGFLDLGYFFPLLIGAVKRALELEEITPYRLISTISKTVPKLRAYILVIVFYSVIILSGLLLVFEVLPSAASKQQVEDKPKASDPLVVIPQIKR